MGYISEDYCSEELSGMLMERGYIGATNTYLGKDDIKVEQITIQSAMKWLREEHNLFIGIHPRLSFTDYYWITADIYRVRKKSSLYHVEDVDDYNCVASCDETSFEGSCEAAIKYCLENLI